MSITGVADTSDAESELPLTLEAGSSRGGRRTTVDKIALKRLISRVSMGSRGRRRTALDTILAEGEELGSNPLRICNINLAPPAGTGIQLTAKVCRSSFVLVGTTDGIIPEGGGRHYSGLTGGLLSATRRSGIPVHVLRALAVRPNAFCVICIKPPSQFERPISREEVPIWIRSSLSPPQAVPPNSSDQGSGHRHSPFRRGAAGAKIQTGDC